MKRDHHLSAECREGFVRDSVQRTIEKYGLLRQGDKVVVAVSGGPDSMALLSVLVELADVYGLTLLVAHLNHGLRGAESDRDERFVRHCCSALGLPFVSKNVRIGKVAKEGRKTIEEAGREARYRFLERVRRKEGFDKVALGHHLDDQAETVLMRFLRGSGPQGLKGMVPRRNAFYIRPLLEVTRAEIIAYLRGSGTTFVEDSSNEGDACLRNRIRHRLMPELAEAFNPRIVQSIGRTAAILRVEDEYMEGAVEDVLKRWRTDTDGDITISIAEIRGLHEALQRRLIKTILLRKAGFEVGIGFRHVESVWNLIHGVNPSESLHMPFHVRVEREYDILRVRRMIGTGDRQSATGFEYHYDVTIPGVLDIKEVGRRMIFSDEETSRVAFDSAQRAFMDHNALVLPLRVRNWMPGDRMEPLGLAGTKKIKEIFIDKKIPRRERAMIPLVVDQRSVLWVAGVVLSDRVKVGDRTKRVLKIEIN